MALKLLHQRSPRGDERFAREARLLFELSHPGIVRYIASGHTEDNCPYLAMEWLEGEDLASRLRRGALDIPDTLLLLRKLSEALAAAHRRQIVHRVLSF